MLSLVLMLASGLLMNLSAQIFPPVNLEASQTNGNVTLNWEVPENGVWMHYDNGENDDAIGLNGGGTFCVAVKFTSDDLAAYVGNYFTKVKMFPRGEATQYAVKIFTDGTEVLSEPQTDLTIGEWNTVTLATALEIEAGKEYMVGYECVQPNGEYPAGNDAGPAVAGKKGDLIFMNNEWTNMSDYDFDLNWNIGGFISAEGSDRAVELLVDNQPVVTPSNGELVKGHLVKAKNAKTSYNTRAELEGYNVYRNGEKINTAVVTELTYADVISVGVPTTYHITAVYDEGESEASNEVEVLYLENQVDRNLVVMEIATGTWCQYCPGAALGADDMVSNGHDVAVIEYHGGDSYETTDGKARMDYYGIDSYPDCIFDGVIEVGGGSHTQSMYANYLPVYEKEIAVQTPITLSMTGVANNDGTYTATMEVEEVGTNVHENLKLHLVITQSEIAENWQGQTKLDFVQMANYYGAAGTDVDFSSNTALSFEKTFEVGEYWDTDHLEVIAFVQANDSKVILQGAKKSITEFLGVGVNNINNVNTKVYPNPAVNQAVVEADSRINNITVANLAGQVVYAAEVNANKAQINTSNMESGIYFVTIQTENGTSMTKLQVK